MSLDLAVYEDFAIKQRPKLVSFAKKNLHKQSSELAEDCVQVGLIQVWNNRERDITNLRQFVYIAILQACMDKNRSQKRYQQRFTLKGLRPSEAACPWSDTYTLTWISQILNRVPFADRMAWLEAFEAGSSRVSMPDGETVYFRTRVARTKKRLKALYAPA